MIWELLNILGHQGNVTPNFIQTPSHTRTVLKPRKQHHSLPAAYKSRCCSRLLLQHLVCLCASMLPSMMVLVHLWNWTDHLPTGDRKDGWKVRGHIVHVFTSLSTPSAHHLDMLDWMDLDQSALFPAQMWNYSPSASLQHGEPLKAIVRWQTCMHLRVSGLGPGWCVRPVLSWPCPLLGSTGELVPSLTGCGSWKRWLCISPVHHSSSGSGGLDAGKPVRGHESGRAGYAP